MTSAATGRGYPGGNVASQSISARNGRSSLTVSRTRTVMSETLTNGAALAWASVRECPPSEGRHRSQRLRVHTGRRKRSIESEGQRWQLNRMRGAVSA